MPGEEVLLRGAYHIAADGRVHNVGRSLLVVVGVGSPYEGVRAAPEDPEDLDDDVQMFVRTATYRILRDAFDDAGVGWHECRHMDSGDGVLVVVPPHIPSALLLHPLTEYLRAELLRHNGMASDTARIRLRMAVHAGPVHVDDEGMTGRTLVHVCRILDAPAFRRTFAASPADLGLAVSSYLHDTVIRHGSGLVDPAAWVWTNPPPI